MDNCTFFIIHLILLFFNQVFLKSSQLPLTFPSPSRTEAQYFWEDEGQVAARCDEPGVKCLSCWFLRVCSLDTAAQSAETNCFGPTLLHLLTSFSLPSLRSIIWNTSCLLAPISPAGLDTRVELDHSVEEKKYGNL